MTSPGESVGESAGLDGGGEGGPAIQVRGLRRVFGSVVALDSVTFDVQPGSVVGLIGANGAGKTTLLSVLATLLSPTSGGASVAGHDVMREPVEVRRRIGYVPDAAPLYEGLTGDEYLDLVLDMRRLDRQAHLKAREGLLERLAIGSVMPRAIGTYSHGMRVKLLLAAALLHRPRVLLLDEPLSALDPPSQQVFTAAVGDFARAGGSALYSSHAIEQLAQVCNQLLLLEAGRLAWQGDISALRRGHEREDVLALLDRVKRPGGPGAAPS